MTTLAVLVLIFVRTDCPIANRYAPELERLQAAYARQGIDFRLVYLDPAITPAQVEAHRQEYGSTIPAMADPQRRYQRLAHVRVTPEAAVFVGERLVYHGRIDDRYVDFGKTRARPIHRDLEETLAEIVAGKTPTPRETKAFGCAVQDLR